MLLLLPAVVHAWRPANSLFTLFSFVCLVCVCCCSGSWAEDKASGMGSLEYCNGDSYDGQWEHDQRHGEQWKH